MDWIISTLTKSSPMAKAVAETLNYLANNILTMPETVKCLYCGKIFINTYGYKRKYCSLECAYKSPLRRPRRGKVVACAVCGKRVYKNQTELKTFKYCSRRCRAIGMFKGRRQSKEEREKRSKIFKRLYREGKINVKGKNNPMYGRKRPDVVEWHNNPEFTKKRLRACLKKPNKAELKLLEIIKRKGYPFEYVGDGKQIIARRCPDFLDVEGERIIELFGEFWHSPSRTVKTNAEDYYNPEKRVALFEKHGYKALVFWERELQDEQQIIERIDRFLGNCR